MNEKQKVLIVDDDQRNLRIIKESFEDQFDLRAALSGEDALSQIANFIPDLVLLDIMMPGIDGYEVCQRMREVEDLSLTKIILVSGKAMVEERLKGYESGCDDYMTKPFVSEELLAKAKVFLRLTQIERDMQNLSESLDRSVLQKTSQLLEIESRLISSSKMSALGVMASGMAHEINTPLAVIQLFTDQLNDFIVHNKIESPILGDIGSNISRTVSRISKIVGGLKNFARNAQGDPMKPASIDTIIEETTLLCKERFRNHNVRLKILRAPTSVTAECRESEICQVLLNLLNNAFDAVEKADNKWVQIEFRDGGNFFELHVTDSGPGIPAEIRENLMQPFFTTKSAGHGTGLGLSISRGIMEAHGGELVLDDKSAEMRFIVRLPKTQGP